MKPTLSLPNLDNLFHTYEEIKLVYFFGSTAQNKSAHLSDYDFAVYLEENIEPKKEKDIVLNLIAELSKKLKTDKIDLVLLNKADNFLLRFNIIKEGALIYQKEQYRLLVEPRILNEYFDFKLFMDRHAV